MTSARRSLTLVLLAVLVCPTIDRAQNRRAMTLVDLLEVPNLGDPQLSSDGRHVLYMLNRADWKANRRVAHIWRADTRTGVSTQITFGESDERFARWSPDGSRIAFIAARSDAPGQQIYLLDATGGEARVLSKHAGGVSVTGVTWAPDGRAIYFLATDQKTEEETRRDRVRADMFAFEEDLKQRHLWRISVPEGVEQRITSGAYSIVDYALSADGRRLVVDRAPSMLLDDGDLSEVWLMNADGTGAVQLTKNAVKERDAQLSPDGSRVLFIAGANARFEEYYNDNLFVVPASGGTPAPVLADFPYEVMRAAWAPDGRTIFLVANMGVHSEIVRIDPAAKTIKTLTDGKHSIPRDAPSAWTINAAAGLHVFQLDEPARFGDVWTMPIEGGVPKLVTHVYDALERDFLLPRQERIEWKAADGVTIEGLLLYPIDYQPGRRYPLVVQVHGGPEVSDTYTFGGITSFGQVLAAKGYFVLKPNHRGSAGYGNAFLRDMVGAYFRNSHVDVLGGVDHLVREGLVDADRLAVSGFSAGGHMANKLITVTDRFKAAASFAGAANWLSLYSQTDNRSRRVAWFGGTPYETHAPLRSYLDQSPLKDAAKVKTPTLFFVGQDDARVPMAQSVEMYRALKANGVETHLYVAPREGHNWSQLRHFLARANLELAWFEKHLMQRAYEDERAPGDPAPKVTVSER